MKKKINQGPPGPPGPCGCTGATGEPGRDGRDGRSFIQIGRINATCLTAIIDNQRYVWLGCYSAVLASVENGRKIGDIRFIGGVLFVVSRISRERWFGPKVVDWTIPGEITRPWLNELKHAIFTS